MDFIWIFIGIFYVEYKLAKEDKNYAPLIGTIFFLILCFVLGKMDDVGAPSIIIALLFLSVPVIVGIIIFILQDKEKGTSSQENDIRTLQHQFQNSGYQVKKELLETLYNNHMSPLYNKNPTVYHCYEWLCKQETIKLINLNTEQLASHIGVPLSIIPLINEKPFDEASLQRKLTLLEFILNQQGLRYHDISNDYTLTIRKKYLSSPEYMRLVKDAISEYIK